MTAAESRTRAMSIRGIPNRIYELLRVRAAQHGNSMEEEVRIILELGIEEESSPGNLGTLMHSYVEEIGGYELELPPRDEMATGVDFSAWQ